MWLNFQLGFLSSGRLHCWLFNEIRGLSFNKVAWFGFGLLQGTHCIVLAGSPSSGLGIERRFWIPYSLTFARVASFIRSHIICRYGVPHESISDRGVHFRAKVDILTRSMASKIIDLLHIGHKLMGQ